MIDLVSKSPFAQDLPLHIGAVSFHQTDLAPMWSVAPFVGQQKACITALNKIAIGWPAPNQVAAGSMWLGLDQVLVFGAKMPDMPAAITDQSDAWVCITVKGQARDVLARLVPVDLRGDDGTVWRTLVGHMTAHITRVADDLYDVMVMRSMADTLLHDLTIAAQAVAARGDV